MTLLQQRITRKEYDSVLVCALAVLGVKDDGWRGLEGAGRVSPHFVGYGEDEPVLGDPAGA